jgi:chromosome segregation ATPase
MRKLLISYIIITLSLVCISAISAEDNISILKDQISALEKQKAQLETERQAFVNQGDELSNKIEEQKAQSNSGLGFIGKHRLSQNLRKSQALSQNIQTLDTKIYELEARIKEKKILLNKEYESQIKTLVQKLNTVSNAEERKSVLAKIKEYQSARDIMNKEGQQKQGRIDIASIEIKDYDSPKEIKEKADLINDVANKTNTKISMLNTRISKLKGELKTRKKMDEFIDDMSFSDRVVKGEVVSKSELKETKSEGDNTPTDTTGTPTLTKTTTDSQATERTKTETLLPQTVTSIKKAMKSNGVSVGTSELPQNSIEEELKALEKQKQELKKELATLNEKAGTFRKKADELEKSGKTGETQGAKSKKQSPENKAQKKP